MRRAWHWFWSWVHRNGKAEAEDIKKVSKENWEKAQENILKVGETFQRLNRCDDRARGDVCENKNQA